MRRAVDNLSATVLMPQLVKLGEALLFIGAIAMLVESYFLWKTIENPIGASNDLAMHQQSYKDAFEDPEGQNKLI